MIDLKVKKVFDYTITNAYLSENKIVVLAEDLDCDDFPYIVAKSTDGFEFNNIYSYENKNEAMEDFLSTANMNDVIFPSKWMLFENSYNEPFVVGCVDISETFYRMKYFSIVKQDNYNHFVEEVEFSIVKQNVKNEEMLWESTKMHALAIQNRMYSFSKKSKKIFPFYKNALCYIERQTGVDLDKYYDNISIELVKDWLFFNNYCETLTCLTERDVVDLCKKSITPNLAFTDLIYPLVDEKIRILLSELSISWEDETKEEF